MTYYSLKALSITDSTQTVTSNVIDGIPIYKISVQVVVGAGVMTSGSVQIQVSNDIIGTNYALNPTPTHWSNLGSPLALSAPSTVSLIAAQDSAYRAIRIVFTGAGGDTAPVDVNVFALCI